MSERNEIALASIRTLTEAIELCWKGSGVPAKEMAERLGIGYSHFQRMLNHNDSLHFPPDLIAALMVESKNMLPLEWLAWRMGYALHEKSMTEVLRAIREALTKDGRWVDFVIQDSGRVDPAQGRRP